MTPSCGPGHADVGEVGGAAGQHALVGGLHVRVRADDGSHLAVEKPAHRELLRRRLGVEVHEDDARALAQRGDLALGDARTGRRDRHEDAAHHVQDADAAPVPCPRHDSCRGPGASG